MKIMKISDEMDVIKELIESDAEVNAKDASGRTPLHYTAYEG